MFHALLDGLATTVEVAALSAVFATVISLVAGIARSSHIRVVRIVAGTYIEIFRGTSAIVQLYFAYYVLPLAGISLSPIVSGVAVLSLAIGAYGSEIVRGGLAAVPATQTDAATMLGMGPWLRLRRVLLPQALVTILPPFGTLMIDLIKATSLLSLITIHDLAYQAENLRQLSGGAESLRIYTTTMVLYFVLSMAVTAVIRLLERNTQHPRSARGFRRATRGSSAPAAMTAGSVQAEADR
jgi:polar amino acid transport system permease protein